MTDTIWLAIIGGVIAIIQALIARTQFTQGQKVEEVKTNVAAVTEHLVQQDTTAERSNEVVIAAAKEAVDAAGKASVTTQEIHSLVNNRLDVEIKAKEELQKQNTELMAIIANQAKLLGSKLNGPQKSP